MKARIVNGKRYRSRSEYAKYLLKKTKMTLTEIAEKTKMTPQTVFAIRARMQAE